MHTTQYVSSKSPNVCNLTYSRGKNNEANKVNIANLKQNSQLHYLFVQSTSLRAQKEHQSFRTSLEKKHELGVKPP